MDQPRGRPTRAPRFCQNIALDCRRFECRSRRGSWRPWGRRDPYSRPATLAELDYRLTQTLAAIYSDPWLRETLYLKGGTALNKLFFPATNRLSIDLHLQWCRLQVTSPDRGVNRT